MIPKWSELRVFSLLRRIAVALERANELELHRQDIEHPPLKEGPVSPKKAVFSKFIPKDEDL